MYTSTMSGAGRLLFGFLVSLTIAPAAMAADSGAAHATLTAAQIVDRHIAARGGLAAWRAVRALSLQGEMDAGRGDAEARARRIAAGEGMTAHGVPQTATAAADAKSDAGKQVQLPITLELKRPHKSRVEIKFAGKTAIQVFDGTQGWKLRPYLNRNDYEPFSTEEAQAETQQGDLEGPLVDYAAKGTKVALDGIEPVEGRNTYKLRLTMKDGSIHHVWIDAQTFLDVKVDGTPRKMDGRLHNVFVYQRDFRSVQGVMIPFVLETVVDGYRETHKVVFDKVAVNPQLDDALFTKPKA